MIDPDALAALERATPQSPHWKATHTKHLTVWPGIDHARAFRALAYYYGVSFSEMFRLLAEWEVESLHGSGALVLTPGLKKDLIAHARVGEDIVPDDLADGVRRLRDETLPGGREGGNPEVDEYEVDEYGVSEADCYCSMGHADNMDIDICHHHYGKAVRDPELGIL